MQGQGGGLGFSENTWGLFPHSRPSLAQRPAWGLSLHPAACNCGVVPYTSECSILTELLGRMFWFPVGSEMVWLTGMVLSSLSPLSLSACSAFSLFSLSPHPSTLFIL